MDKQRPNSAAVAATEKKQPRKVLVLVDGFGNAYWKEA